MTTKLPAAKSEGVERLKLQLRASKIEFVEEVEFDEVRKWRFDLAFPNRNGTLEVWDGDTFMGYGSFAVEVDGGNHMVRKTKTGRHVAVGRHTKAKDYEKLNAAAILGWSVLRFTPAMVKSGEALETIKRALG